MVSYEHGSSFNLANHNVNLSDVGVELFHEVLCNEIRPSLLVSGVLEDGAENIIED